MRDAGLRGADDLAVGGLGDEDAVVAGGVGAGELEGHVPGTGDQERQGRAAYPYHRLDVSEVTRTEIADQNSHAADATGAHAPGASQLAADGGQSPP
ncbi:hypothetical protein GCM10010215_62650 [Streptomyces virginiae]|uniref:Uncharacterized protein n=1 Tax=Streptomyces virginiae TaxID=1961 RepID=A0ABQ3NJ63_STRVG|nr:hypothetical protein GCM10010215_62650 [Streptomyces virginiae]GHI12827.1 hypothetical protein Scinn_22900 [Streptomyces virginiae]GLV92397.1 hypothetical protein Slala04_38510 [Streptomyces lavendulae subsp. lavendulae]